MKKLFLVYGTLKAAHGNHRVISHPTTKSLGTFVTPAAYTLYDGGFPIVERGGKTAITGELYEVEDDTTIDRVFGLEGCMRPERALIASNGETEHDSANWYDFDYIDTPEGKAVMFVMDAGEGGRSRIVENGIWH